MPSHRSPRTSLPKYDDDPTSHYSYDSNVANSSQVGVGDRLVFWDEVSLIGASTVASIDQRPGIKKISRCPYCTTTNIASRKTKTPRFRCDDCHGEFDAPVIDEVEVTVDQTDHQQGWVDLAGLLDGSTMRGLTGYSQNSIRRIDWDQFASAVGAAAGPAALTPIAIAQDQIISGGHTTRQVSVRIGQPAFRAELVRKYGTACAFTGPAPAEVLEACHLYSYAEIGGHDIEGGLLLRRDLHRLFDQGLLAGSRPKIGVKARVGSWLRRQHTGRGTPVAVTPPRSWPLIVSMGNETRVPALDRSGGLRA